MRIVSPGHAVFAITMIVLGAMGFVTRSFAPIWLPVPHATPAREFAIYLCAFVALAGGVGLLLKAAAAIAARGLAAYLFLWMLLFKAPFIIRAPLQEGPYQSMGETAVIVAAAWVLATWFASEPDNERFGFLDGALGLRLARVLYGLALIAFGLSHFYYENLTTPLVPDWLPAHQVWAYFTGGAYLAAGVAIIVGVFARLAAVLVLLQIALITLLVWGPRVLTPLTAAQWVEPIMSWVITAGAWVMADSYRDAPWLVRRAAAV
jgi:uncharacterized membrane protein